jgi:hypothetical protein
MARASGTWQPSRPGVLALMLLVLLTACATGAPLGGGLTSYRDRPLTQQGSPEEMAQEEEAEDEHTGEGEAIFATLPTNHQPVEVRDAEFRAVLTALVLDTPLRVAAFRSPLYVSRKLALASTPLGGAAWRSELARSYGRFCERRGTPGDCLTLFEDGPDLQADDRRSIALALAVGPALEGLDAEVRATLNPTRLLATVSIAITGYMALLLAPEPVTKGVAAAFTVLLWGYLGWEFFDLLRAYTQLSQDAERASTFAELRDAGERFGRTIGPNSVRILVMLGTAAIGETAALLSKVPKLPGFGQASRTVEVTTGLRLGEAATAERIIISVSEGALRAVLPVNAVAMVAPDGSGARSAGKVMRTLQRGKLLQKGYRAFKSFTAFKRSMGSAGKGKQWHHIIEKHKANLKRFGAEALHNTENVIAVNEAPHTRISAFYSSIQRFSEGMTVRKWLSTQSYEAQRAFGLQALRDHGVIP